MASSDDEQCFVRPSQKKTQRQNVIANAALGTRSHSAGAAGVSSSRRRPRSLGSLGRNPSKIHAVAIEDIEEEELVLSSRPVQEQNSNGDLEEVEETTHQYFLMDPHELHTLKQSPEFLQYKLWIRQQTLRQFGQERLHSVRSEYCGHLRYIKWPKLKSQLLSFFSYRLWSDHLKHVECHFGSSVVSYFVFLRWIFLVNTLITLLWFSTVCVPQIVAYSLDKVSIPTSCVYDPFVHSNVQCASNSSKFVLKVMDATDTIDVCKCLISNENVASRDTRCHEKIAVNTADSHEHFNMTQQVHHVLCTNLNPQFQWYQYILDIFTGTGIYNDTMLFHGAYSGSINFFHFDLAFLVMVAIVYLFSIFLLVFKMGDAYNESYSNIVKRSKKVNFSNKLFTAWDFNLTDRKTSEQKKTHNATKFMEDYVDAMERAMKRSWKLYIGIYFLRFWTNVAVLLLLIGGGAAIYFSAKFEFEYAEKVDVVVVSTLLEYLSSIVISVLNAVYPVIFYIIALAEFYKTESARVSITLIRTVFIRLSSLLLLLVSLYELVAGCIEEGVEEEDTCTIGHFIVLSSNITNRSDCPVCWETYIGQQFYKLAILNFFTTLGSTILYETGRNILYQFLKRNTDFKICGKQPSKIVERAHFNIPKSILDLIYTQTLMWLGFLFSPLIPIVVFMTSFCLFYIKKYSLMYNLDPGRSFSRSARTNFLFLFLLLLALFAAIVPVLYAVTQIKPSENCGPFRGLDTMYEAVTRRVSTWPCSVQILVNFINSAGFTVPFIVFLLLVQYALYIALRTKQHQYKLMSNQIQVEGADINYCMNFIRQYNTTAVQSQGYYYTQPVEIETTEF